MTQEQIGQLLVEIRNISHGGNESAMGLEAVVMALAGEGKPGDRSVADSLDGIAEAILELAQAVRGMDN